MTQAAPVKSQQPIKGRVARVLSERELVINIGSDAGVKQGMRFAVLSETPLEIRDPSTNDVLDLIDREKVRVEAQEVRSRVTVCKTYRIKGGVSLRASLGFLEALGGRAEVETLRANDASLPPPLAPEESYVKINDRVIAVGGE
ncbi:MAG: hypothetical protein NTU53_13395 [Planctomycetota bacterium]|nr:hypothetical protein [Planctomycetota bacterium]